MREHPLTTALRTADKWVIELLGGERDGQQISLSKMEFPNFPPDVYKMPERIATVFTLAQPQGYDTHRVVTFRLIYLRDEDNVFVYERRKPQ
jgi:hypothetical protein